MAQERASNQTRPLKVATLNLFNYLAPPNAFYDSDNIYTQSQWQLKQQWLSNHLQSLDADVVAFQEVFSIDCLKQQLLELGYPYFVTLDTPAIEHDYLYSQPVVALASRFAIIESDSAAMTIPHSPYESFKFSRIPLRATVDIPNIGPIDYYVVHFKSKRLELKGDQPTTGIEQYSRELMGGWFSLMQRGSEAHLLHRYIIKQKIKSCRPFMLMGDFNNQLSCEEFACFTQLTPNQAVRNGEEPSIANYTFHDAWTLDNSPIMPRPATHYYGSNKQTLDYILLSDEFCHQSANHLATLTHYQVNDEHLVTPNNTTDLHSSDHASVMITIEID